MNEFRRTSNFTLAKNYQIITVPVIRKNWQRDATTRLCLRIIFYHTLAWAHLCAWLIIRIKLFTG